MFYLAILFEKVFILVLCTLGAWNAYTEYNSSGELQTLLYAASVSGDLATNLQRERGMSCVFLSQRFVEGSFFLTIAANCVL